MDKKSATTPIPSHWPNRISLSLVCGFSFFLCGCFGVTRIPARSVGPDGAKIEQKELDLKFIQPGSTQHDEVGHQLAAIDTGCPIPSLFWGRWRESKWGYWWVFGVPCDNCMAGDAGRLWRMKNLLVQFDENGLVTRQDLVEDKLLWRTLHSHIRSAPLLDFSEPVGVTLTSPDPIGIVFSPDYMEFERPAEQNKPNVRVPIRDVVRFSHSIIIDDMRATCHTLELSQKSTFGRKIKFCAEPSQVALLFQYLQQVGPSTMRWQ